MLKICGRCKSSLSLEKQITIDMEDIHRLEPEAREQLQEAVDIDTTGKPRYYIPAGGSPFKLIRWVQSHGVLQWRYRELHQGEVYIIELDQHNHEWNVYKQIV